MKTGRTVPASFIFVFVCVTVARGADASRQVSTVTVRPDATTSVQLRSTERLPDAAGEARVERRGGTTEIEINLDSLKPASLFGGDYNTYVLWIVPPVGPAQNAGEFYLDDDRSAIRISTKAVTFGLLVTAEPHYLVSRPSPFVVLESPSKPQAGVARYEVIEGIYNFNRSSLADVKHAHGRVHTEVRQAFTAVRLAQRVQAGRYAPDELREAQEALDRTLDFWHRRVDRSQIAAQGRATVRLAQAAQQLAEDRAFQARVEEEGSGGGKGEPGRRTPRETIN